MPSVFLSHSSADKPFARKLAREISRSNVSVWIDEAELKIGDSLLQKIGDAIEEMDFFALVLSKHSVASEWVQRELRAALTREFSSAAVIVLPILMERVEIPIFLRDKVYADFTLGENFDLSVARLLVAIHGSGSAGAAASDLRRTPTLLKSEEFFKDLRRAVRSAMTDRVYIAPSIPAAILERAKASCGFDGDVWCVIDCENSVLFNKGRTAVMFSQEGIHFGGRTTGGADVSGLVRFEDVRDASIRGSVTLVNSYAALMLLHFQGKELRIPSGNALLGVSPSDVDRVIEVVRLVVEKHTL